MFNEEHEEEYWTMYKASRLDAKDKTGIIYIEPIQERTSSIEDIEGSQGKNGREGIGDAFVRRPLDKNSL